jgi:hypothetical protein
MSADAPSPAQLLTDIGNVPVRLVAFAAAGDVLSSVGPRRYLHAGPPLLPSQTTGAMRGALIGALLLEEEAESAEAADMLIEHDELEIAPCHDNQGVGALAGVVSPRVPVTVVGREDDGSQAFGTVVEGLGRALAFGNYDTDTLEHVKWLSGEFSETMRRILESIEPIDVVELQAKGLRRGDEGHNRIVASTEKLINLIAPALVRMGGSSINVLEEISGNPHFFLSASIAAAKSMAMAVEDKGPPGVVTALAGNGLNTGIKVSGAPRGWYVGDPVIPTGLMLVPGREESDAGPLMGDSGVTETMGLGAFSMTASLALARVLGVDSAKAQEVVDSMRQICITEHPRFGLPADDFRGSPFGISVASVARTGITPAVNAGYAHRVPGEGRVGANVAWFPTAPFEEANADLADVER